VLLANQLKMALLSSWVLMKTHFLPIIPSVYVIHSWLWYLITTLEYPCKYCIFFWYSNI